MARSAPREPTREGPSETGKSDQGPVRRRSCTDIICLLLFLVFVVCWTATGIYAFVYGDINMLLVPRDSYGRRCGVDSDVKDKPYLFFFDLAQCVDPLVPIRGCNTPQLCVKNCPSEFYVENGDTKKDVTYCRDDGTCPKWYLPSKPIEKRCLPNNFNDSLIEQIRAIGASIDIDGLNKAIKNIKLLSEAEQVGQNVVEDIMSAWWKIGIGLLIAVVICMIYIGLLKWIAGIMIWFAVVGVIVALGAEIYFTTTQYKYYQNAKEDDGSNETKKKLFLAGLIIGCIVLTIILLILIFLRNRLRLAVSLIKEGSKAVTSVKSVLFFPIIPWLLQIGIIAYTIAVALFLTTTGSPVYKIKNGTDSCSAYKIDQSCDPEKFLSFIQSHPECKEVVCKFQMMDNPVFYPYLQVFNVFGFFWAAFFATAFGEMVLAMVFADWYWTFDKRDVPFFGLTIAAGKTMRYHLGTLAFGSLIIAICRMIRVVLEYISKKVKKYDNPITKALLCCLKCFFWCLENFLKFINKNAYIMCAVHGKNFCASAKDAFSLLMRNIVRVFVLDKVTDFLFFLSSLLVALGVGALSYLFFVTDLTGIDNSGLNYALVPVIIIMVCTFLIATLFFNVYSMAVDTLFLCFLEDCEKNDGSSKKPYYMSKNLMKILGKRNKSY